MRWCVAKMKPKQDDWALENLQNQAFNTFVPLLRTRKRRETLLVPMFPGYVFVEIEPGDPSWKAINSTRGVMKLLMPSGADVPSLVPRGVVELLIQQGVVDRFEDTLLFKKEDLVRFVEGPFEGRKATCQWTSERRVHLLLNILGRQTKVFVEPSQLKLVHRPGVEVAQL